MLANPIHQRAMQRSIGIALGLAGAAFAAGCTSVYVVPADAPTAKVRLVTTTDNKTRFLVRDTSQCPDVSDVVLAEISPVASLLSSEPSPTMSGQSPQPPERTRERTIEAGQRINLAIETTFMQRRCVVGVSFDVVADAEYEVRHTATGAATQCSAAIYFVGAGPYGLSPGAPVPNVRSFPPLSKEKACMAMS